MPFVQRANPVLRWGVRAFRDLSGRRSILQWFAGRLGRLVVELHGLGGLRVGFVRSDLGDEGKSPNTEQ